MLFNTFGFFVFLAVMLVAFYASPTRYRRALLVAASYYFYMSWNAKFILLLLTLTAIDFYAGQWVAGASPRWKKVALVCSLTANLGFLGFFKYYNFLASNVALLIGLPQHSFYLDIVLPLGISFHTFQSMSYVIDVYRGEQKPITQSDRLRAVHLRSSRNWWPGPIVRAHEFFARPVPLAARPSAEEVLRGVLLVMLGLVEEDGGGRPVRRWSPTPTSAPRGAVRAG